jgi:hypothetical protein
MPDTPITQYEGMPWVDTAEESEFAGVPDQTVRMTWGQGYYLGTAGCKRCVAKGGDESELDVYLRRFQDRTKRDEYGRELIIGSEACDGYITGWNDQAVGNDYDEERH